MIAQRRLREAAADASIPRCGQEDFASFVDELESISDCASTPYDWASSRLPTYTERVRVCSCEFGYVLVPDCYVTKGGLRLGLLDVAADVFAACPGEANDKFERTPASGTESDAEPNDTLEGTPASGTESEAEPALETDTAHPIPSYTTVEPVKSAAPPSVRIEDVATASREPQSSNQSALIGGIVGGIVAVTIIVAFSVLRHKRARRQDTGANDYTSVALSPPQPAHSKSNTNQRSTGTTNSAQFTTVSTGNGSRDVPSSKDTKHSVTWDDPAIIAVRIPLDAIFVDALLSRGGFGEVYRGTYRGETVAIKQLLPEKRKDLAQIDNFLGEVKLMATLEHERIVKFIGVAWNSLSDACVVTEFMENGDLRSVLTRWNSAEQRRLHGFDRDKVKIALHIAHALTYLHSLQPVVLHRDLKSKNILLDANMDAKLTDFGISRERADSTMTAAVGSSLWMAPEVMMGERYNEKADVFSFGVVLSELDTHQLPYSHAKEPGTGHKLPETAILQQVMLGRLTVAFTDRADMQMVELARECVALDPASRPSAAQVLYRVHLILRQY